MNEMAMRTTQTIAVVTLIASLLGLAPSMAASTIEGTFELAGAQQRTRAQIEVTETGPLSINLELAFAAADTGEQITAFAEELTQELHILAVDKALTQLVH